jgi:transcriptional regulator with XRE-family HTH domain
METIVGKNLKLLREANKFSQEQVSSFLGINRSAYSNYETGDREAPLEVLEKVSNLYGCDMYLLFEEKDQIVKEMLVCAFRVNNISESDMVEIAHFKDVVKNYIKINQLLAK